MSLTRWWRSAFRNDTDSSSSQATSGEGFRAEFMLPDFCRGEGLLAIIVIAQLLAIMIVVADSGIARFDWIKLGQVSLLALGIALLNALALCWARPLYARLPHMVAAVVTFCTVLLIALACMAGAQWLLSAWGRTFDGWQLLETTLLTAIPAGILLRYLYLQQQLRVQQKAELESRIQALQSRIRPHFLFNSMNMIASLIGSDPEKAEKVVEDLADLFRYALADSQTLVPLRDELSLCRRYLALESMRLGKRLKVEWQIGDYGDDVRIPCLTLQPVLENAIYHGIQLMVEGGTIKISVLREGDRLMIEVINPRSPVMDRHSGHRVARKNINSRLEAYFGMSASVTGEESDSCYITRISYPVSALR